VGSVPLEAVEDQVQAERERALIVRAAWPEVLLDVLDQVGQFLARKLPEAVRHVEAGRARGKVVITG